MTTPTCIICFEENNLKKNTICENGCNFYYHEECYIEWQKRERHPVCLVCKESVPNLITGEFSLINPLNRHVERHEINYMHIENRIYRQRQEGTIVSKYIAMGFILLILILLSIVIILVTMSI
jgi:hypothetical protein